MKTIHSLLAFLTAGIFFLLTSCTQDFCENAVCQNNGVCNDGACLCATGYTGTHCEQQITPAEIEIRSIQVTRFPGMNNGASWDPDGGPDLYFRLYNGTSPLAQPMLAVENADHNQDYYFFIDIIAMHNVLTEHSLQLRDYDAEDADDLMGEVKFIPYNTQNGFPSVLVFDDGGPVAFKVEVDYIYPVAD